MLVFLKTGKEGLDEKARSILPIDDQSYRIINVVGTVVAFVLSYLLIGAFQTSEKRFGFLPLMGILILGLALRPILCWLTYGIFWDSIDS
jgi:hypothetical protein